ncbi:MAG: hypothetical protein ACI4LB_02675 [Candidatus Fimenecus sp.]
MKYFSVVQYKNNAIQNCQTLPFADTQGTDGLAVQITAQALENGGTQIKAVCTAQKPLRNAAVRLVWKETDWDTANYVFAPAALYNGNRFHSLKKDYPPMLDEKESAKYKGETVVTDVPRLSKDGNGCAQLSVGDLSFPCFGYFSEKQQAGFLVFFKQENELGNFGITVQENAGKHTAEFILSSPCMRMPHKYSMCTTAIKSDDRSADLHTGDTVTFSVTEYCFKCTDMPAFLKHFLAWREMQGLPRSHPQGVPWEYAFHLIEEKYNRRNWVEDFGFYTSSEATAGICRQWQTGWVGGAINTLPALVLGSDESKEKSRRTLDFVFTKIQHESGFLYGIFCDGRPYGDNTDAENINIVLVRKNTDALYYLAKQLLTLRQNGEEIKPLWHEGLLRLTNAFLKFYEQNGEIGQFIDIAKNKPYTAGSASGGLLPAGLALCNVYFDNPLYLQIAEEIGAQYYKDFIAKGFSTGGPGEILSCPDSESAFALLESYVVLYRATNEPQWLRFAEDTAALCASWCVGYDYHYKNDTQFAERGVATTGAVWASVQNKHAAPGICTMSGESLFHLYRATGNTVYLDLLKDIAHNITQFVSTPEHPMRASYVWHNNPAHRQKLMARHFSKAVRKLSVHSRALKKALAPIYGQLYNPIGRINERVNLSDWDGTNNVGEVPAGSCWCEVSTLLTYLEIPAVYIQPDTAFCFALDHIACTVQAETEDMLTVKLHNPTKYDAQYRILIENAPKGNVPLPPEEVLPLQTVFLRAGEQKALEINRRER